VGGGVLASLRLVGSGARLGLNRFYKESYVFVCVCARGVYIVGPFGLIGLLEF